MVLYVSRREGSDAFLVLNPLLGCLLQQMPRKAAVQPAALAPSGKALLPLPLGHSSLCWHKMGRIIMSFMIIQICLYPPLLYTNEVTKQAACLSAGHDMVRFYGGGKESMGSALLLC